MNMDLEMSREAEKSRGFGFVTVPEFASTHLIELNGIQFHGKPILIEKARSQSRCNLKFDLRLRNTQNAQNLSPPKESQKNPPPIPPKQNTYSNYAFKPRKKNIVFFSNRISKNLKMKDFNAAVKG